MSATDTDRSGFLGASDIAKAWTGRYGGAASVVAEKIGLVASDINPELADRGHRWEPGIAAGIEAHTGLYVAAAGPEQIRLQHRDDPRWCCTPDGLLMPTPEGGLGDVVAGQETKTRGPHAPWAWDYWLAQPQWSMYVSGLPRWLLVVATIDQDYDPSTGQSTEMLTSITYRWVEADPYTQGQMLELAEQLWSHAEARTLPEPTDAAALPFIKAANATAGQTCPTCGGTGLHTGPGRRKWCAGCDGAGLANIDEPPELSDELSALIARRESLLEARKKAEAEADLIEAKLRAAIGEATEVRTTDGAYRVRCGLPTRRFTSASEADFLELHLDKAIELGLTRTVLDKDRAKELMPEEYDALRIATPDRRLTVKNLRPEETQ